VFSLVLVKGCLETKESYSLINTCVVTGTRLTTLVPSFFPRSIYSIINIHLQSFPSYHANAIPPLFLLNDVPLTKPPSRREECQHHLQQKQLDHICSLEECLMDMDRAILLEQDIASLSGKRLPPLDVN
jgi:hypothetical protein